MISEALAKPTGIKFFHEDVSVLAHVLPRAQRLTIIPDIIYRWRIGGGSSRYVPSMLENYLKSYSYIKKLSSEWPIPQDTDRLLKTELICMVYSWLRMCREPGHFNDTQFIQEIQKVSNLPEVIDMVNLSIERKKKTV